MTDQEALEQAIEYFAAQYANTGADWDECIDHAWFMYRQCGSIDRLYYEAARYEDM